MGAKGGGGQEQIQRTEPWDRQIPYLRAGFDAAAQMAGLAPAAEYFGSSRPFNHEAPDPATFSPFPGQPFLGEWPGPGSRYGDTIGTPQTPSGSPIKPSHVTQPPPPRTAPISFLPEDAPPQGTPPGGFPPEWGEPTPVAHQSGVGGLPPPTGGQAQTASRSRIDTADNPTFGYPDMNAFFEGEIGEIPRAAWQWRLAGPSSSANANAAYWTDLWNNRPEQPNQPDPTNPANFNINATLAGNAPQYFPWATLAGESGLTEMARQMQETRALEGNAGINLGQEEVMRTLSGDYLRPETNPYLSDMYDIMAEKVRDQVGSAFSNAGMFGSTPHQGNLADSLGDMATQLYGQNYQAERSRMLPMLDQARAFGANDYFDIANLAQVGNQRDIRSQVELDDAVRRWNYDQNAGRMALTDYMDLVQGGYGGTTMSYLSPQSGGNLGQAIGAGLMGLMAIPTLGASFAPMAAGLGGLIGGGIGGGGNAAPPTNLSNFSLGG